jgi:DICT domain-containing protein
MREAQRRALSISDLADRTGVAVPTLRSWEARSGFPDPQRMPGGHRRYAEDDVLAVQEVLRHRDSGLPLAAAVRRVREMATEPRSVYAELRRAHPALVPQALAKETLIALSHAIEDECCARAARPLLFGSFQRARFLRASRLRWDELARTAAAAVVFADLPAPADAHAGRPIEVAVPSDAPISREWAIVCDARDFPACLVAVERPGQPAEPDARRRFDAVWTVDPAVVRTASRVAAGLADAYRPGWRPDDLEILEEQPATASPDLVRAADLLNRMVGYLDAGR